MTVTLTPTSLLPVKWALTGGGGLSANAGNPVTFTAPVRAANPCVITATCAGVSWSVTFNVIEPASATATRTGDFYNGNVRLAGQGMNLIVTVNPTTVSFGNVFLHEEAVQATSRTGYFRTHSPMKHNPFPQARLQANNTIADIAYFYNCAPPWNGGQGGSAWVGGSMTWNIPLDWRCPPDANWHRLQTDSQEFNIVDANGGSNVSKTFSGNTNTSGTRHPTP